MTTSRYQPVLALVLGLSAFLTAAGPAPAAEAKLTVGDFAKVDIGMMTKDDAVLKKGESYLARALQGDNPAFYTGNGAWSKETAKRVRYGYLLQYAYWKQKAAGASKGAQP